MDRHQSAYKLVTDTIAHGGWGTVNPSHILLSEDFFDDINMDSLDFVEFLIALEWQIDVSIPDEDAMKMRTVRDVVDFILRTSRVPLFRFRNPNFGLPA